VVFGRRKLEYRGYYRRTDRQTDGIVGAYVTPCRSSHGRPNKHFRWTQHCSSKTRYGKFGLRYLLYCLVGKSSSGATNYLCQVGCVSVGVCLFFVFLSVRLSVCPSATSRTDRTFVTRKRWLNFGSRPRLDPEFRN